MFHRVLPNGLKKSMLIVTCLLTNYAIFSQVEPDTLTIKKDSVERVQEARLPVFNQSEDDNDDMGSQDIAGLLQSSRDVFTATAGFSFGPARFRIRGYGGENTTVLINGIRMNEMETGRAMWNGWAGLNDVTRATWM
jgi:outer membrane cobalamin receptor